MLYFCVTCTRAFALRGANVSRQVDRVYQLLVDWVREGSPATPKAETAPRLHSSLPQSLRMRSPEPRASARASGLPVSFLSAADEILAEQGGAGEASNAGTYEKVIAWHRRNEVDDGSSKRRDSRAEGDRPRVSTGGARVAAEAAARRQRERFATPMPN